jgi:phosphoglycerate kinase
MRKLTINSLPDNFYRGKKVLLRADYNVPIRNGVITEDYKIRQTIPTIEYLAHKGAKIIIISHLGRPNGVADSKLSLKSVAERLIDILNVNDVQFVDECTGKHVMYLVNKLDNGELLLLENLRFYPEEEKNDPKFCKEIAGYADIFVNDAFATSHRKHASTSGIPKLFEYRLAGFVINNELVNLEQMIHNPRRPFLTIIGGSKITDKLNALEKLLDITDKLIIGGCIANTFLNALDISVGNSFVEKKNKTRIRKIMKKYKGKIIMPQDFLVESHEKVRSVKNMYTDIPNGHMIVDIGRDTVFNYSHHIMQNNGTIFWNGPMGQYEIAEYSNGTNEIARAVSCAHWRGAYTVVAGGDTIASLRKADVMLNEVDFVSTGGSAALKYIGGIELPGISVLNDDHISMNVINSN